MTEKTYNLADICQPAVFQLDNFCEINGLQGLMKADLVCIKCSSKEVYDARRNYYDMDSRFIYQAVVSGRRIALVGLKDGLKTGVGDIGVLEIVDQKADNSQIDRLSHIAIVPTGISYEEVVEKLKSNGANLEDVSRGDGYTATDVILPTTFRIRIEKEPLLDRIKREELK
jgi:predicted metalloenzyme YecM